MEPWLFYNSKKKAQKINQPNQRRRIYVRARIIIMETNMLKNLFIAITSYFVLGCTAQIVPKVISRASVPIVAEAPATTKIKKVPHYFMDDIKGCRFVEGTYKSPECPNGICEYGNYVCAAACPL